jgi:chemotaxis protein CheD
MQVVVGMSDMKVSKDTKDILITYSLGSCIGITVYDPMSGVGGILHFMLPDSSLDSAKARKNPFIFADTGIPALFEAAFELGAKKGRLKVVIAGGANILDPKDFFQIGKKNYTAARRLFKENRLSPDFEDVGGDVNRTVSLMITTGSTVIKTSAGAERRI